MALLLIQGWASEKKGKTLRIGTGLEEWIVQWVKEIKMVAVGSVRVEHYDHWDGDAPSAVQYIEHDTGMQPLKDSAIVVHTYPDNFIQVLLDSCKPIVEWEKVRNKLAASLEMNVKSTQYISDWAWPRRDV